MEINKNQAMEIIRNLKTIINEDINYILPSGIIIASSDTTRMGTFHGGAFKVSQTKKPLVINYDNEYEGSKMGINLPVFYKQDLIAVIGITGKASEITKFSQVIVKMTEILIKENLLNTQRQFKRENNRVIMELIIKDKFNPEVLKLKMEELSYEIDKFRYFIVAELKNFNMQNIELSNLIYGSIEKRISMDCVLSRYESRFMMLSQIEDYEELTESLEKIKQYLENKYKVTITIGISEKVENYQNLYRAYRQAISAVEMDLVEGSGLIKQFDSSSLDYLFQTISSSTNLQYFSKRMFGKLTKDEITEINELINKYVEHNGSINRVSENLFIHKNTVQYRLKKIKSMTGYDPRKLKDLIGLYLVLKLINKQ